MIENWLQNIIRRSFLGLVVITVLVLFTLPVIFYFIYEYTSLSSYSATSSTETNASLNYQDGCHVTIPRWTESLLQQYNSNSSKECISHEYGHDELQIEGHVGGEGICGEVLSEWTHCAMPNETIMNHSSIPIYVPYQVTLDEDIKELFEVLDNFPDCQLRAIPFLCQYYYPLVDCGNDMVFTASKEECTSIVSTVCSVPWNVAVLAGADSLPNCESLQESQTKNKTNITAVNSTLICQTGFFDENGVCVPNCEQFQMSSYSDYVFESICEVTAGVSAVGAFIVVMIYSIKQRKRVIRFPTIFTLILLGELGLAGFTILLAKFTGPRPLCSYKNLLKTRFAAPTDFCKFSGAILHYTLVSMTILWFAHLSILVFRVAYPFTAQQLNHKKKFILLNYFLVGGAFLLPLPAVIVSLASENYQYRISQMPPRTCNPPGIVWFYSLILPVNVLLAIGICFLCYIIWIFNKIRRGNSEGAILGPGERKLIIVFALYLVFGLYGMVHANIVIANESKVFTQLVEYFQCEFGGHVPGKCSRSGFESLRFPVLIGIFYLLFSLIPFSVLSFVVDWQQTCLKHAKRTNHSKVMTRKVTTFL